VARHLAGRAAYRSTRHRHRHHARRRTCSRRNRAAAVTSFNSRFWPTGLDRPIASLPIQIFTYAVSPYDDWHRQAWAAALLLMGTVLVLNIAARLLTYQKDTGR
jgi:hypothetical protein